MYDYNYLKKSKCYKYAKEVVNDELFVIRNGEKIQFKAPKYVKKNCQKFLDDLEKSQNDDYEYFFNIKKMKKIEKLLKLLMFGDGFYVGESFYDTLADFQWYIILNLFCWVKKDNPKKRKHEIIMLLITRKEGKTNLSAIIFILLMLLEPQFSEFYSVSATKDLATQLKKEIRKTIKSSDAIAKHFKDIRSETRCTLTDNLYVPLACDNSSQTLDGRKPQCWLCDETGALRSSYPIEALSSGQIGMLNRTGIIISTAYSEINPMEDWVEYGMKVYDGFIEDESYFGLIYRPDDINNWLSDISVYQTHPLAVQLQNNGISDNLDYVFKKRQQAIEMESAQANFKTKLLNIKVSSVNTIPFVSLDDLRLCRIDNYDWTDKEVWVSFDLSISGDNTAVSILTWDEKMRKYITQSWCFIPEGKIEEKMKKEKVDYISYINTGYCFACGDKTISYSFVEDFIINTLKKKYKVKIKNVSYDRYNATSTVGKLEEAGIECIDIAQSFAVLNEPTKKLRDWILNQEIFYVQNNLFELNISNAMTVTNGTGTLEMISKKSSNFKVDMLASLINVVTIIDLQLEKPSVYETEGITFTENPIFNMWDF